MAAPRIAVGPDPGGFSEDAVRAAGGEPVPLGEPADGLLWMSIDDLDRLRHALHDQPGIRWVQLPLAGIERAVADGIIDKTRTWTCAKGTYAEPVAEHALMLALAGLRGLAERARAHTWGAAAGLSLYGAPVTILGGGGITEELLRLLDPFGVEVTVVRRLARPVPGAARTVTTAELDGALPGALVVFLALALTPDTERIIGARQLAAMDPRAWLVNVARGRHVDTAALVAALQDGSIGGAGLDVTDPEPLPDGHPLWSCPNCIITPHTANTAEMAGPRLAQRIGANIAHFALGEPLEGLVDPAAGY